MDYYSLFWGTNAIFLVYEPQGTLTCMTLTLAGLSDSGPFRGLLFSILGPRAIFMVAEAQCALMCRLSTLAILADSCPFHGLLLTVLAPGAISKIDEH